MESALLWRRAALHARSISKGAIAGAVIGSVLAAVLIVLCFLPFILRARRLRRRRYEDPFQSEMGQGAGGSLFSQRPQPDHSHRRLSGDPFVPGPVPDSTAVNGQPQMNGSAPGQGHGTTWTGTPDQKPQLPLYPPGVNVQQGLPSPVSPPLSPGASPHAAPRPGEDAREPSGSAAVSPISTVTPMQWHNESIGTIGRDSSRDLSLTSSAGAPSREPTGFTNSSITEEPGQLDFTQPHHHHKFHFPHLPETVQRFIHPHRRQSQSSRSSGRGWMSEGPQSPSIGPEESIAHAESAPAVYEQVDTEARGAAWSYYHPDQPEITDTPAHTQPSIIPPAHARAVAPISPISPDLSRGDSEATGFVPPSNLRSLVEEPEAISPDSDKTVSPKEGVQIFKTPSFLSKRQPGEEGVQRMDSLGPQDIVADIPSPPTRTSTGPSGNPMDMMRPTTDTEHYWKVNQEIYKMENSPSPDPGPSIPPVIDEPVFIKPDPSPEPVFEEPLASNAELAVNIEDVDMMNPSPYSNTTPPPSSGPSNQNTPDTRITDPEPSYHTSVSPSPSGVSDMDGTNGSRTEGSPKAFPSEECGRSFDQIHKLNHHKRYHQRPHECQYPNCGMRFGTKTHLDRHINDKHIKTKKYYCKVPDCPYSRQGGKSFPRKDNWRRHMQNKHQITPEADPGAEYMDEIMGNT